tara:strand:- start:1267 stop:1428 length:162 start_codon:yes stop_codon:yes gene_type:complete
MKIGDLVRWKIDGSIGVVTKLLDWDIWVEWLDGQRGWHGSGELCPYTEDWEIV